MIISSDEGNFWKMVLKEKGISFSCTSLFPVGQNLDMMSKVQLAISGHAPVMVEQKSHTLIQAITMSEFLKALDSSSCFRSCLSQICSTPITKLIFKKKKKSDKIKILPIISHCSYNKAQTSCCRILVIWHLTPFLSLTWPSQALFALQALCLLLHMFCPSPSRFFSCFNLSSNVSYPNRPSLISFLQWSPHPH